MTEKIYNYCLGMVNEKHSGLSNEEINNFVDDIYSRFLQRILIKTTDLVDSEVLEEMAPMLDTAEDEDLLMEIAKHTDIEKLIDEVNEEIRELYLKEE